MHNRRKAYNKPCRRTIVKTITWDRNAEVPVTSMGFVTELAMAEKPTFHSFHNSVVEINFFPYYSVGLVVQKHH